MDKIGNVGMNDFKNFVLAQCKTELDSHRISKKDVEGFLSNYVYNPYGETEFKSISPKIYGLPELNTDVKRARPTKMNKEFEAIKETGDQGSVSKLSQKLVDKVFMNNGNFFSTFKDFDVDGDGYVSYQDFSNRLKRLEIEASDSDVLALAKFFDPDKNGYIEFKDFSQRFTPNLPTLLQPKEKQNIDNDEMGGSIVPNQKLLGKQDLMRRTAMNTFRQLKTVEEPMRPSRTSRFGATPAF